MDAPKHRNSARLPLLFSGLLWALSWSVIYLEIHRWHHMTPGLHLNPPASPPGYPPARPGEFLIGAIVLSIAAPVIFAVLLTLTYMRCRKENQDRRDVRAT